MEVKHTFIITISGLGELDSAAEQILGAFPGVKLFLLEGNLGAGKTTLVKALCRQLGCQDNVSSPTFSIINEYSGLSGVMYHMDLYRLKTADEAWDTGLEDYLESGAYCFIEWPQIIQPYLNQDHVVIMLSPEEDGLRIARCIFFIGEIM